MVWLGRLPQVALDDSKRLKWIKGHTALALSERERMNADDSTTEPLTIVKRALERIFTTLAELDGTPRKAVFRLKSPSTTFEVYFFVPSLKLDVASHTITSVLILDDDLHRLLRKPFGSLRSAVCEFDDIPEVASYVWRGLLPALVEHCRD